MWNEQNGPSCIWSVRFLFMVTGMDDPNLTKLDFYAVAYGSRGRLVIDLHYAVEGAIRRKRASDTHVPQPQSRGRFILQVVGWLRSAALTTVVVFHPSPVFSESYFTSLLKTAS